MTPAAHAYDKKDGRTSALTTPYTRCINGAFYNATIMVVL